MAAHGRRAAYSAAAVVALVVAFVLLGSAMAYASDGRIVFVATGVGKSEQDIEKLWDSGARGPVSDVTHAPEIATMWGDGTHLHTLVSSDVTHTSAQDGPLGTPVWSSNRLWVAYFRATLAGEIRVVRWDGARNHAVGFDPPWSGWTPKDTKVMAWSPSGRYLIMAENGAPSSPKHGDRDLLIMIDLRGGTSRVLGRTTASKSRFNSLSFSPDGRYLAVGEIAPDGLGNVTPSANRLISVSTGKTVYTYPSDVCGIDIAPDGQHVSFVQGVMRDMYSNFAELRLANLDFRQRRTIATEVVKSANEDVPVGMWRFRLADAPGATKWSMDGTHIGMRAFSWFWWGELHDGPFVGAISPRGRGLSISAQLANQFDW